MRAAGGNGLEFRVLGPLEVTRDGRSVAVGGAQLRTVLARLLVDAGHRVSVGALVTELWGEHTPADADRTARTYVSRLRAFLGLPPKEAPVRPGGDDALLTRPGGYELRVAPDTIDAVRFERLATSGRRAHELGQARAAVDQLTEALSLWQGDAYGEFDGGRAVAAEGERLNRMRLGVIEDRTAAALAVGLAGDLVGELEALVRAHPVRERLWGHYMVALYRSGRQAEALAAFRDARSVLVDEHGIEPSPELVGIHRRILRHDPVLAVVPGAEPTQTPTPTQTQTLALTLAPPPAPTLAPPLAPAAAPAIEPGAESVALASAIETGTATVSRDRLEIPAAPVRALPVPAQLPIGVRDFTGRAAELARLDTLLPGPAGPGAVVAAITGTAGVGKTSLAIHWAHRSATHFPDGQLYVNLRGYAASGSVLDPAEALRGFLEALGIAPEHIPAGLDARAALYRTMLAGKRMLVVLDNVRDAGHARPLLPGSAGSMAVVTSRTTLAGLVATEGAHRVVLDVLSHGEARDLLASRLGPDRVAAEPGDVDEIIARCASLPLALAIASARESDPARLAAELRATAGALDAFDVSDDTTSVTTVLSWSYRVLGDEAARLFRLLGCHPGPDLTEHAAASLARLGLGQVRVCLRELRDAYLITEQGPGRYAFHDLLRAFAADCAQRLETPAERRAATRRMVDHYLHTAVAADRLVYPNRTPIEVADPVAGVIAYPLPDPVAAWSWLDREHQSLLAAQRAALDHGWGLPVWQLAWAMSTLHQRRGHPQELHLTWQAALSTVDVDGEPGRRAIALRFVAEACLRLGRFAAADRHLDDAATLAQRAGDVLEEAQIWRTAARAWYGRGDDARALEYARRALALFRRVDRSDQLAPALNAVGWYAARVGDDETASTHLLAALELARDLGDRLVEGHTLHSLGFLAQRMDRHEEAVDLFLTCRSLAQLNGDAHSDATALHHLGDSYAALGDRDRAWEHWCQALHLCEAQARDADAARLRDKLGGLVGDAVGV